MTAEAILADLLACGIEPAISHNGSGIVVPAGRLTAEQRSAVLAHKSELLDCLQRIRSRVTTTPSVSDVLWCWPHSTAMNALEVDTFNARLDSFTEKGLALADAEKQAGQLVIRDRDGDDRVLCLECDHLCGIGRWRCGNWNQAIGVLSPTDATLPSTLVITLQRCDGFEGLAP